MLIRSNFNCCIEFENVNRCYNSCLSLFFACVISQISYFHLLMLHSVYLCNSMRTNTIPETLMSILFSIFFLVRLLFTLESWVGLYYMCCAKIITHNNTQIRMKYQPWYAVQCLNLHVWQSFSLTLFCVKIFLCIWIMWFL